VLNRKKQDITAGNNLEKPHVFLKRTEVRSTDTKDEVLAEEGMYMKKAMHAPMARMMCAKEAACYSQSNSRGYNNLMMDMQYGGGFGGGKRGVTLQRKFNGHNNFLSNVGHLSSNISDTK
jgi:hypothetical protein